MGATVRYIVDDVSRSSWFYELLGFEVVASPGPGFALLRRDDLDLALNVPGAGGAGQGDPRPGGWNRFQLRVDDLDAEVERLREAGVHLRSAVVEGRGGRQVLADDPSGNPVELFEPAR